MKLLSISVVAYCFELKIVVSLYQTKGDNPPDERKPWPFIFTDWTGAKLIKVSTKLIKVSRL